MCVLHPHVYPQLLCYGAHVVVAWLRGYHKMCFDEVAVELGVTAEGAVQKGENNEFQEELQLFCADIFWGRLLTNFVVCFLHSLYAQ